MKRFSFLLLAILPSCDTMTPATQAILAQGAVDIGKIYVSRGGKAVVPADGPDAPRIYDPVNGPNFGPQPAKP